jgi:hypothetical protein
VRFGWLQSVAALVTAGLVPAVQQLGWARVVVAAAASSPLASLAPMLLAWFSRCRPVHAATETAAALGASNVGLRRSSTVSRLWWPIVGFCAATSVHYHGGAHTTIAAAL